MKVRVGIGKKEDLEFSYFVYKSYMSHGDLFVWLSRSQEPQAWCHMPLIPSI